jgi:hypothetical protein
MAYESSLPVAPSLCRHQPEYIHKSVWEGEVLGLRPVRSTMDRSLVISQMRPHSGNDRVERAVV